MLSKDSYVSGLPSVLETLSAAKRYVSGLPSVFETLSAVK